MTYISIDGEKYEKELLDLVQDYTAEQGARELSQDDVWDLITSVKEGVRVSDIEKKTLLFIRENFLFNQDAARLFDETVAELK
ncbi:hypothetical protein [Marinagarivorans algicola]|uniref:hypothetical protein n=1 Tax=Marinagarivorans algicola TaxID=1513270 RepID=UPI0006B5B889|nr:hypothetical protein [Marinagarivorans algicola]